MTQMPIKVYIYILQLLINICVCTQLKNFRKTRTQTADFFKHVIVLYFSFSSPFWSIQKLTKVIDNKYKKFLKVGYNKLTQLCCNISLTDIYQVCDNLFAPIGILQSVLPGLMDTEIVPDIIIHLEPFLYFQQIITGTMANLSFWYVHKHLDISLSVQGGWGNYYYI